MNHYEILEVSPVASPEVIRAAYRSLMQRYHPDRNPGDAVAAERASRVVQAYEVLSDAARRAAYDRQLQALASPGRPAEAAYVVRRQEEKAGRGMRPFVALLLLALLGAVAWAAFSLRKPATPAVEPPRERVAPESRSTGLEVRSLFVDVSIGLKGAGDSSIVLFIPAVGVRVGAKDPDGAVRHLINSRELLAARLMERLAEASPDELLKPEGEAYLARLVLEALQDKPARDEGKEGKDAAAVPDMMRYGAVDVFFPKGYRVK